MSGSDAYSRNYGTDWLIIKNNDVHKWDSDWCYFGIKGSSSGDFTLMVYFDPETRSTTDPVMQVFSDKSQFFVIATNESSSSSSSMKHVQAIKFVPFTTFSNSTKKNGVNNETVGISYEIESFITNGVKFWYWVSTKPIYSFMEAWLTRSVVKTINTRSVSYVIDRYGGGKSSGIRCTKRVNALNGDVIDYVYEDVDSGRQVVSSNDSIYLMISVDLTESESSLDEYNLQVTIGTTVDILYNGKTRVVELTVG